MPAATPAHARGGDPLPSAGLVTRVALIGNPNTGKTTVFNRLSGLRHKTSNFPGTTQEARLGFLDCGARTVELIDLPGVYSLELDQTEAEVCRSVLAGQIAPRGEPIAAPDAVCVVIDSTNPSRGLVLLGETLRRRLPTLVALNMSDLARRAGMEIDEIRLSETLGCPVIRCSARSGEGLEALRGAMGRASIPIMTPPGDEESLVRWAESVESSVFRVSVEDWARGERLTDRVDRGLTHPIAGVLAFGVIMTGLFWSIFSLASYPMDWIESVFGLLGSVVKSVLPAGVLRDLLADGVVAGIAGVVVFLPQICLLFFLISLLEDTGYLARAAFVMDRVLRPFGLPGHSFVPLLSSHACALPGIMAARAVPDRRERLATILVAPFVTCSARLPVYVLVTGLLFPGEPMKASLAFVGAYALGIAAAMGSALLARRTILRGPARPMALELPTYKWPSVQTALLTTYDRALVFLKKAGTNILAICIALWWLSAFPHVAPPAEATAMRERALAAGPDEASELNATADRLERSHASAESFMGRIGRTVQPVFAPLGYDWQLTVGVMASFAAREVFVSTMAVVVAGEEDAESEGVIDRVATAKRSDGVTPVFTRATCWSLLVYYVLAMQCLPTLAVTAREAGGVRWALLQLAWMSGVAYLAALAVYQVARAAGVA
ncbi:MAG: ferrous iron transporter B [Phycisphaerae bacterium]|nr:ferrous iron transporter B [Phycisphaerae bacterium]